MRILVVGAAGMLGQDLTRTLSQAGHDVRGVDRPDIDITDPGSCREHVPGYDALVNAAAWTAVDDAETQEDKAFAVNATGAAHLARAAREHGVRMVHLSTDYVFAGDATVPYSEDAPLAPRSAYGRTKAAGEWAVRAHCPDHLIVRTAWLYGAGGPNFVKTMVRLASSHETLKVVDDQRGQPTCTVDLSRAICSLLEADAPAGIYHGTSGGEVTWHGFTQEIFRLRGLDPQRVQPTTTDDFPRPAPRPAYSVLGHDRWDQIGLRPIRSWQEALADQLDQVLTEQ